MWECEASALGICFQEIKAIYYISEMYNEDGSVNYDNAKNALSSIIAMGDDASILISGNKIFGGKATQVTSVLTGVVDIIEAIEYGLNSNDSTTEGKLNTAKSCKKAFDGIYSCISVLPLGSIVGMPLKVGSDILDVAIDSVLPRMIEHNNKINIYGYLLNGDNSFAYQIATWYEENRITDEEAMELLRQYYDEGNVDIDPIEWINAQRQRVYVDPLVFDLDGDGVYSTTLAEGVYFDFGGDGFREKTAWIDNEDGFLVREINEDGKINDGTELFGDQTVLEDGSVARSGFQALRELDSNVDGRINLDDNDFSALKIWIDNNHDGISQQDELFGLAELGIQEIFLQNAGKNIGDGKGNTLISQSSFTKTNGTQYGVAELNFSVDSMETVLVEDIEIDPRLLENMPELTASGVMLTLRQAMTLDVELEELVQSFLNAYEEVKRHELAERILVKWAKCENIEVGSRGNNIDAVHLGVLEKFYGAGFYGVEGANPNVNAARILNSMYNTLKSEIETELLAQSQLKWPIALTVSMIDVEGNQYLDYEQVKSFFRIQYGRDQEKAYSIFNAYVKYLSTSKMYADCYNVTSLRETFADMPILQNHVFGDNDDNNLNGTSQIDFIYAGDGADSVSASGGNDTLEGGRGNDYLVGDVGNDTYVFNLGDGKDTIYDYEYSGTGGKSDRIVFGEGVKAEEVIFERSGNHLIIHYSENDSITIQNVYYYGDGRTFVESMEFADGTVWKEQEIALGARVRRGTAGDDTMTGYGYTVGYREQEIFYTGEGADTITANGGADEIYAGAGNDTVYAGAGNDILEGGNGNDYLAGETGNDTYVFNLGDGKDTIYDYEYSGTGGKSDRIVFGVDAKNLSFSRNGSDLLISILGSEMDSVKIQNWYVNDYYKIENIHTSDNYSLSYKQVDLLIQSMASFENSIGMSWEEIVMSGDESVNTIISQAWIKSDV